MKIKYQMFICLLIGKKKRISQEKKFKFGKSLAILSL